MEKGFRNRAQISVFIILAIVVVIGIGAFLFLNNNNNKTSQTNEINAPIADYIQSCIENSVDDGINWIGFQGGYYDVPEKSAKYAFAEVPYYFSLGEKHIPNKKTIESELSKYIETKLNDCIKNSGFEKQGYELEFGKSIVRISLGKVVNVKINYPIQIAFGGKTSYLKDFSYTKEFDFDRLYRIINEFADEHQKNPDFVPLSYVSILAKNNDFHINLIYLDDLDNNGVVYSFIFSDLYEGNQTFIYNFAAKYKWEQAKVIEKEVEIEKIPYQHIFAGKEFSYQIKAKGENVKFDDYTELFNIDKNTGIIRFTPLAEQSRGYQIIIRAYDNNGNEDNAIMNLDIERVIEDFNLNDNINNLGVNNSTQK